MSFLLVGYLRTEALLYCTVHEWKHSVVLKITGLIKCRGSFVKIQQERRSQETEQIAHLFKT